MAGHRPDPQAVAGDADAGEVGEVVDVDEHLGTGQTALAEETLHAAIDAAPTDVPPRVDLAELMAQSGRADAAIVLLEETVRTFPSDLVARMITASTQPPRNPASRPTAMPIAADSAVLPMPNSSDTPASFVIEGRRVRTAYARMSTGAISSCQGRVLRGTAVPSRAQANEVMSAATHRAMPRR